MSTQVKSSEPVFKPRSEPSLKPRIGTDLLSIKRKVQVIKPPIVRHGSTIGIVSPSYPAAALFPHRVERGRKQLEAMGFVVKFSKHALKRSAEFPWLSASAKERAEDLNAMFADPDVRAIIGSIGGDHSVQMLPYLDYDKIKANPKPLIGYSDNTVLQLAIWAKTKMVSFYGPMLMTEFAEFPAMFDYTQRHFLKAISKAEPIGKVEESNWYTEERLEWATKDDLKRERKKTSTKGWSWLLPGKAEGTLVGGCIESLPHLRGTEYWPSLDDAILFLETSEEAPSPAKVDSMLSDYEAMGAMEKIKGLLFGRPYGYSEEQKQELRRVLVSHTKDLGIPVVADMDFGHTSPMFTLPIGCRARIDAHGKTFEIPDVSVI